MFGKSDLTVIHRTAKRWNSVLDLPAELRVMAGQMSHKRGHIDYAPPRLSDIDFSPYVREGDMLSDIMAEFYYACKEQAGHYWNHEAQMWVPRETPVWVRRIR